MAKSQLIKLRHRSSYEGSGPLQKFIPLAPGAKQINDEQREITFTISTSGRDRDGDVILQEGWQLDNYMKNPIVLWAHDPGSPPIARAKRISIQSGKLVAVAQFPDRETYEFGDTVYRLYKGGYLNATSVGFNPLELELMEGPEPGDFGFRFMKQELMEFSAVPIPSNPEALIQARSKGFDVSPLKREIERILDEHSAAGMEDVLQKTFLAMNGKLHPSLQEQIAKRNLERLNALQRMPEDSESDDEDDRTEEAEADPVEIVSTSPSDNPDATGGQHDHELEVGAAQTEPSEEDGHMHAVDYEEDGTIVVQDAEGHGHDVSASAPQVEAEDEDEEEDDEEKANENPTDEEDVEVETPHNDPNHPNHGQPPGQRATNTPRFKTLLETSEYQDVFPVSEAKALREDWPELWGKGEHTERIDKLLDGDKNTLIAREKFAARYIHDWNLKGTIEQIQNLVVGSRGLKYMREVLSKAKQEMIEAQAKARAQNGTEPAPEGVDEDALIERIMERAVVPAIEAAIRRHSGRVS